MAARKTLFFFFIFLAGTGFPEGMTVIQGEEFPSRWKLNPSPTRGVYEYRIVEDPSGAFKSTSFVYLNGHLSSSYPIAVSEGDRIEVSFFAKMAKEASRVSAMLYTYYMHPVEKRLKWSGSISSPWNETTPEWKELKASITIPAINEGYPVDSVIAVVVSSGGSYLEHAQVDHHLKGGLWQKHYQEGRKLYSWDNSLSSGFMRPAVDFGKARRMFQLSLSEAVTDEQKAASLLAVGEMRLYDQKESNWKDVRGNFEDALKLPSAGDADRALALLGIGETFLREKKYPAAMASFEAASEACSKESIKDRVQLLKGFSYMQQRDYARSLEILNALVAKESLERTSRDLALDYIAAMRQSAKIRRSRPRLFFSEKTWPAVRDRALGEEKEYFEKIRKESENLGLKEGEKKDYGLNLMKAAFVYRVTGNKALLEKIQMMFRSTCDYYLARENHDHTRSYSRVSALAALDWTWEDLPEDERESFFSDLLFYSYSVYLEDRIQGRLDRHYVYYVQDMLWYAGAAFLDEKLDDVIHARVMCLLGHGYRQEEMMFSSMLDASGDDGAWQVKLDYAFGHQPTVFWAFMYSWQAATGEPIPPEWVHIINPDYVLRNFLGITRNSVRQFGYDRSWGTKIVNGDLLYDHLSHTAHFFDSSNPGYASIALHLRQQIEEKTGKKGAGEHPVNPFLHTGAGKTARSGIPENMPVGRHFENAGLVFMSSGFGPDDTYALLSCGGGTATALHHDATHFSIYRKGHLALDSGTGNPENSPHTVNYAMRTVAHNAVLVEMPGERFPGSQSRITRFAKTLAFESDPLFVYTAVDASGAYAPEKCRQMVRQFIYLKPDIFLVFDRVSSSKAEYGKTWLLHTSNEPILSGKDFMAEQGEGRIFCRTLYPENCSISKVGGPGMEFFSGGRNWPIESHFAREKMSDSSAVTETLGRWRVEVRPSKPVIEDMFLHLIQVSDQATVRMTGSRTTEENGKIRVFFSFENLDYEISLNRTGNTGGHVKIIRDGKIITDRPFSDRVMPQAGLVIPGSL